VSNFIPRERILVGGPSGASKTYSFLKIVENLPSGHHVAIEVDDGYSKMLEFEFPKIKATISDWDEDKKIWVPRPECNRGDTLQVFHCRSFRAVMQAQRATETAISNKVIGAGDWISADGLDLIYNNMRYQLIDRALPARDRGRATAVEDDPWETALRVRATGAPMLEGGDWDMIHSFYEGFLNWLVFQIPCHIYCTTGLTTIQDNSPYEQDDIKEFYKSLGVPLKFEGQKRTPRAFDTLMAFKHDPSGYYVHCWKDRGGLGRSWGSWHSVNMAYTNKDFYQDILVPKMGHPAGGKQGEGATAPQQQGTPAGTAG
jgi:hypothetical protein